MTTKRNERKGIKEWAAALASVPRFILVVVLVFVVGVLLLVLSPVLLGASLTRRLRGAWLNRRFRRDYASRGTVAILVYSESPNWQADFENKVLPKLGARAEVLNWSQRREWEKQGTLPIQVYLHHRPPTEFNPYALVFGPKGPPAHFPFFLAFRAYKHGKRRPLEEAFKGFWSGIEAAERAWEHHRSSGIAA